MNRDSCRVQGFRTDKFVLKRFGGSLGLFLVLGLLLPEFSNLDLYGLSNTILQLPSIAELK